MVILLMPYKSGANGILEIPIWGWSKVCLSVFVNTMTPKRTVLGDWNSTLPKRLGGTHSRPQEFKKKLNRFPAMCKSNSFFLLLYSVKSKLWLIRLLQFHKAINIYHIWLEFARSKILFFSAWYRRAAWNAKLFKSIVSLSNSIDC